MSKWYGSAEQRDQHNKSKLLLREKYKRQIFEHYSGGVPRCACCGELNYKFLTLDHIEGGGTQHRQSLAGGGQISMYRWIKKSGYPAIFQILCYNCNCARQFNGGVCPHKDS